MKPARVLLFIVCVLAALGAMWLVYPQHGINICGLIIRFPNIESSYEDFLANNYEKKVKEYNESQRRKRKKTEIGENEAEVKRDETEVKKDEAEVKKDETEVKKDETEVKKDETKVKKDETKVKKKKGDSKTPIAKDRYFSDFFDTISYYRDFLDESDTRILFPNNDYSFFDPVFKAFENSQDGMTPRIVYYGDSQIERDVLSGIFRQRLQDVFGGYGANMIPAIQKYSTISINQKWGGDMIRYAVYGEDKKPKHNRYGIMTHFAQLNGKGVIEFRKTENKAAQPNVKKFNKVSLLVGHNVESLTATLNCSSSYKETRTINSTKNDVTLLTWNLPQDESSGSISLQGNCDVYAVLLDGGDGVAVDNVGIRGCSGTVFARMNDETMIKSYKLLNTKMIVLQFGGNAMPGMKTMENIKRYVYRLEVQMRYFKKICPDVKILFIGPADMSRKIDNKMVTWPLLPELNDAICEMVLENGGAYWDMYRSMGGKNTMVEWVKQDPPLAGKDHIHFTTPGAKRMGEELSDSFLMCYEYYKLRKNIPEKAIRYYDSIVNAKEKKTVPTQEQLLSTNFEK